ncbi:MAG TPA: hypothetical protein PLD55_08235 [bacterium]|nr:hypothetical protein [bacterium]
MKNIVLRIGIMFLIAVFLPVCLTAKGNYSKVKKDASDAFAELDGSGPASPAPASSSKKGGKPSIPDVDVETAVLKGTGYGNSEKTAKMDALTQLSHSIVARIKGETSLSQVEKDGKYTESLKNDITVNSAVFLKGVEFTAPKKVTQGYEVTALMSAQAVINTITYLITTLPDDLEALEPVKYDSILTTIYLAFSLLYSVPDSSVPEKKKYISMLSEVKNEIERLASHGSIYFSGKTGLKGSVDINGTVNSINKKIFLKPGNYNFLIKADGYKNLKGSFQISKGDKKFVELVLIPEKMAKKEVHLQVISEVRIVDDIEKQLLDFGIIPAQNEELPHWIVVTLKGSTITVDNYRKYILEVDVHTFKNGQKYKITHYEHKPFFVTPQNEQMKIREETKNVSLAVVKKFFSSINLEEFLSD